MEARAAPARLGATATRRHMGCSQRGRSSSKSRSRLCWMTQPQRYKTWAAGGRTRIHRD